jgi:hypothetical protein
MRKEQGSGARKRSGVSARMGRLAFDPEPKSEEAIFGSYEGRVEVATNAADHGRIHRLFRGLAFRGQQAFAVGPMHHLSASHGSLVRLDRHDGEIQELRRLRHKPILSFLPDFE